MSGCCGLLDHLKQCDNIQCKVNKTAEGIQINLIPKDKEKVKAMHKFLEATQELCDCDSESDCCGTNCC